MAASDNWLYLTQEDTLEPALPICDPHHHLWDKNDFGFVRDPRYLLDELLADTGSGHNVVSTVFIECHAMYRAGPPDPMKSVGETEFVNGIAAMSASGQYGETRVAAGIVGTADPLQGDTFKGVLEAHIEAGGGRFRGIRRSASWNASDDVRNTISNPPEGLYLDAKFREGLSALAPLGLSLEGWCYHPQLPELADLARALPDLTIIMNHCGGVLGIGPYAGRRDEVFQDWSAGIAQVAQCPNVFAKLGGLNMDIVGFGWSERDRPPSSQEIADATAPYFNYLIEQFGPERCMFESNFPVDKIGCSYNVLWNSFKRVAANCSAAEKAALFHDTAARAYRLDDPA